MSAISSFLHASVLVQELSLVLHSFINFPMKMEQVAGSSKSCDFVRNFVINYKYSLKSSMIYSGSQWRHHNRNQAKTKKKKRKEELVVAVS